MQAAKVKVAPTRWREFWFENGGLIGYTALFVASCALGRWSLDHPTSPITTALNIIFLIGIPLYLLFTHKKNPKR